MTIQLVKVSVRIGNGKKVHPAEAEVKETDPGQPWNIRTLIVRHFNCSCPNTDNGRGRNKARIVCEGWERVNCRIG